MARLKRLSIGFRPSNHEILMRTSKAVGKSVGSIVDEMIFQSAPHLEATCNFVEAAKRGEITPEDLKSKLGSIVQNAMDSADDLIDRELKS